jgi:hypothetical protein
MQSARLMFNPTAHVTDTFSSNMQLARDEHQPRPFNSAILRMAWLRRDAARCS